MLTFALFFSLTVLVHGIEQCVDSSNSCQCKVSNNPPLCLESLGNGTCLQKPCDKGYVCSCQGYEVCTISKCDDFFATDPPSETIPSGCSPTEFKRSCLYPAGVADTFDAARIAEAEAVRGFKLIGIYYSDILKLLERARALQNTIDSVVVGLIDLPDSVSKVDVTVESIAGQAFFSSSDVRLAREMLEEARMARELAGEAFVNGTEIEKKIDAERAKEVIDGAVLNSLEMEFKRLEELKKRQAVKCGNRANEIMGALKRLMSRKDRTRQLAIDGQQAADEVLQELQNGEGSGRQISS